MNTPVICAIGTEIIQNALYCATLSGAVYADDMDTPERREQFSVDMWDSFRSVDGTAFGTVGKIVGQPIIVVTIRGSDDVQDWAHNIRFAQVPDRFGFGPVHAGFQSSAASLMDILNRRIAANSIKGDKIIFTGHSLGGAIATILGCWLSNVWIVDSVYTFGQPAVGSVPWALSYPNKVRHCRFFNDLDVVPHLPPLWMGPRLQYQHVGTPFKLDGSGNITQAKPLHNSLHDLQLGFTEHHHDLYVDRIAKSLSNI